MNHPIFVYGSVMTGGFNNYIMDDAVSHGETQTTEAHFSLIDMLMYPAAIYGTSKIHGELFMAPQSTLDRLDILEQNGTFYERILLEVDSFPPLVWMYMLMEHVLDTDTFDTIPATNGIVTWKKSHV